MGSPIQREGLDRSYRNIIVRSHAQFDLCDASAVRRLFDEHKPEDVVLAAARVGGAFWPIRRILRTLSETTFKIQGNLIEACRQSDVTHLFFLGFSRIYRRVYPQPIRENYLLA